jgi:hypothetical protein
MALRLRRAMGSRHLKSKEKKRTHQKQTITSNLARLTGLPGYSRSVLAVNSVKMPSMSGYGDSDIIVTKI